MWTMSAKEKLYDKLSKQPWRTDVTFEELSQLLKYYGFTCSKTNTGSHFKFCNPKLDYNLILPYHRPMKAIYIRKAITAIQEVNNF